MSNLGGQVVPVPCPWLRCHSCGSELFGEMMEFELNGEMEHSCVGCFDDLTPESDGDIALDDIAQLVGCPVWDSQGQLVRDVEALVKQRDDAVAKLKATMATLASVELLGWRSIEHHNFWWASFYRYERLRLKELAQCRRRLHKRRVYHRRVLSRRDELATKLAAAEQRIAELSAPPPWAADKLSGLAWPEPDPDVADVRLTRAQFAAIQGLREYEQRTRDTICWNTCCVEAARWMTIARGETEARERAESALEPSRVDFDEFLRQLATVEELGWRAIVERNKAQRQLGWLVADLRRVARDELEFTPRWVRWRLERAGIAVDEPTSTKVKS